MTEHAQIPMQNIGPLRLHGPEFSTEIMVPLATFEQPLWPSVNRGARLSMHTDGIHTWLRDERMTRSITLEGPDGLQSHQCLLAIQQRLSEMQAIGAQSSRFVQLIDLYSEQVGALIYLRFEFTTGDAAGHNMVTLAAQHLQDWLLDQYPQLQYVSISGNLCSDKKVSAINSIRGRGKAVGAEIIIPQKLCQRFLKASPADICALHLKKNLIGSTLAGSIRSANAHFANMLLAFYLATGQDAANIVEGSQGMTHTAVKNEALHFSVSLPNIIVGTVGNGKELPFVQHNLKQLDCLPTSTPGQSARKLACIAAATVLCGELSLLAAQTNRGELMASHVALERGERL
jgi:hydroxymethylglutaryl-CoA reductase (NADPH)